MAKIYGACKKYLRGIAELETQIALANMLKYIDKTMEDKLLTQTDEIGKMIRGLQHKLNEKLLEPSP